MSEIKERPILFSGPMVCAILEGRKGGTRRPVKPQPDFLGSMTDPNTPFKTLGAGLHGQIVCPYGKPGERLWVRESFYAFGRWETRYSQKRKRDLWHFIDMTHDTGREYQFEAPVGQHIKIPRSSVTPSWWRRPSIHMPRHASRILLEITAVRVERLHDGDGETAFESRYLAEGINEIHHGDGEYYYHAFQNEPGPGNWCDPFDAWRELWVSINGIDSWNANPWVWVVEFKRVTP